MMPEKRFRAKGRPSIVACQPGTSVRRKQRTLDTSELVVNFHVPDSGGPSPTGVPGTSGPGYLAGRGEGGNGGGCRSGDGIERRVPEVLVEDSSLRGGGVFGLENNWTP